MKKPAQASIPSAATHRLRTTFPPSCGSDADGDVRVRARVPGHRCPAVGERVALVVDGAVMAYAC
ncbi:hypothetical protein LGM58_34310 [Burkholderia contaminans]|uniref:hypothetical protein n=1 Tax=Burkholderia contaminans TaxID=488447 RepID=UPI000F573EBF|nr:hypothetical protein [Burkholderia contaminans]MCA7888255.1 hypothetical protein [Burkholderia contaminans]